MWLVPNYIAWRQRHVCEQLAQSRYLAVERPAVELATSRAASRRRIAIIPLSHTEMQIAEPRFPAKNRISDTCQWTGLRCYSSRIIQSYSPDGAISTGTGDLMSGCGKTWRWAGGKWMGVDSIHFETRTCGGLFVRTRFARSVWSLNKTVRNLRFSTIF